MPENPEAQSRARLVTRLRAHADIESDGHAIDLRQAANEIEDLCAKVSAEALSRSHRLAFDLGNLLHEFVARETGKHPLIKTTIEDGSPDHFKIMANILPLQVAVEVRILRRPDA
jgi:hypothetical protein